MTEVLSELWDGFNESIQALSDTECCQTTMMKMSRAHVSKERIIKHDSKSAWSLVCLLSACVTVRRSTCLICLKLLKSKGNYEFRQWHPVTLGAVIIAEILFVCATREPSTKPSLSDYISQPRAVPVLPNIP